MRDNAMNVRSRKQDYINATESVLKLLRIVKDNSPSKNIELTMRQRFQSRDSSLLGDHTGQGHQRRREKKSLRDGTLQCRRMLPYQSKLQLYDYIDADSQPLFPHIGSRRVDRFGTEPAETNICSAMNLQKKEEVDVNLQTLRSKRNLHNLFAFEDSIARQPQSSLLKFKRRMKTDINSASNFQPIQQRNIASLQRVLISPQREKTQRKVSLSKPTDTTGSKHAKDPMSMTRRLIQGAYSGWEFETTNTDWQFPLVDAVKRRHR